MTEADLAADDFIRGRLPGVVPGIPVITEETFDAADAQSMPDRFILVDPLDGTREFAAGRDEFTVNIALVEGGAPVVGTIYAPAMSQLYVAGSEAFSAQVRPDAVVPGSGGDAEDLQPVRCRRTECAQSQAGRISMPTRRHGSTRGRSRNSARRDRR